MTQIAERQNKSLIQYIREMIPTGSTLAAYYYDLQSEYDLSGSNLLFDSWLATEKPALVSFFRSIEDTDKQALLLVACLA